MALTDEERRKIGGWLDQLSEYEQQRVLSSQQSFETWLYNKSRKIYEKVKDWLSDLWNWLFG
jgi:hypothetical protein